MACIERTGIKNATPMEEATRKKAIVHNPKKENNEVPPPNHATKIVPKAKEPQDFAFVLRMKIAAEHKQKEGIQGLKVSGC